MLIIQTNVRIHHRFPDESQIHSIVVTDHPTEFAPEAIFLAANRITSLADDVQRLRDTGLDWTIPIRQGIDECNAPSMSPEDLIHIFDHSRGRRLGYWTCELMGWSHTQTTDRVGIADVINHTHTHHLIPAG